MVWRNKEIKEGGKQTHTNKEKGIKRRRKPSQPTPLTGPGAMVSQAVVWRQVSGDAR